MPVDSHSAEVIASWLSQILEPYRLPDDFINKLRQSIQEVISRLISMSRLRMECRVYISQAAKSDQTVNNNWGFFKMEKVGGSLAEKPSADPVIEYFFYLEK